MIVTINDYRKEIAEATSKEELRAISCEAFKANVRNIMSSPPSETVDALCLVRELELDGYTKNQIKSMTKYKI